MEKWEAGRSQPPVQEAVLVKETCGPSSQWCAGLGFAGERELDAGELEDLRRESRRFVKRGAAAATVAAGFFVAPILFAIYVVAAGRKDLFWNVGIVLSLSAGFFFGGPPLALWARERLRRGALLRSDASFGKALIFVGDRAKPRFTTKLSRNCSGFSC